MPLPTISMPPDAPSRSDDAETFVAKADAFLAWFETLVAQLNAFNAVLPSVANSSNYTATSTTSLTIGTGSKSLNIQTDKFFTLGQFVLIPQTSNPSNWMFGQVVSYNASTGALVVLVSNVSGSGTFTDWTVSIMPSSGGFLPLAGGTLTNLLVLAASASGSAGLRITQGAAPSAPVNGDVWTTSTGIFARINGVTLQLASRDAAETLNNKRVNPRVVGAGGTTGTLTPTADTADVFSMTGLTGPVTIAAPSGTPVDGQKMVLRVKDDGTSRALTFNAIYRIMGPEALVAATVPGKMHYFGCIYNAIDTKWDVVGQVTQP